MTFSVEAYGFGHLKILSQPSLPIRINVGKCIKHQLKVIFFRAYDNTNYTKDDHLLTPSTSVGHQ